MTTISLTHLSDGALLQGLVVRVSREQTCTAELLAYIAEVDARKLYLGEAYESMFLYCTKHLHLSDQSAYKRINCARVARRFPEIFTAIADGRLHLCGVLVLGPHLSEADASGLIAAATHRSRSEIEMLVAERFPRPDVPTVIRALPALESSFSTGIELSPGKVCHIIEAESGSAGSQGDSPPQAPSDIRPSKVKPIAPQRYSLQTTLSEAAHQKLQYIRELLSHELPSGEISQVIEGAFDAFIEKLEKRKFAETAKPRKSSSTPAPGKRHIQATVKHAVWKRDGARCTFVSQEGHRCSARKFLEFDHIQPFARGGAATTEGIRLRCRAHNQYTAELTFGAGFMEKKRSRSTEALDVVAYLRNLGLPECTAKQAAALCEEMSNVPIEERIRMALRRINAAGAGEVRERAVPYYVARLSAARLARTPALKEWPSPAPRDRGP